MKDLRNLLLDCRAALRRADPHFENSPLRARMDENIIGMSKAEDTPKEVAAAPQTFSAQQVAYAWQQAARELHFTHPQLYAELGREVRERLQADTLVDPNAELVRLEARLRQLQAERDTAQDALTATLATAHRELQAGLADLQDELATLRQALSAAVALDGADAHGSEVELAQRRLRVLVEAAQRGGGLPKARPEAPGEIAPSTTRLQQVSSGSRAFSDEEREWCIGEAVVRSHFALSPAKLLADGDRALATLLLQASRVGA
ncbi:hypothetical protein [Cognatiluteimonas profundi]|uniref:hypothetical protein n=1 Tax=Cognatiluteimonas profundi TaxID=2594501 RepID=UPI00131CC761|nr:hypothetical protein [Lysobacter profundi]